MKKTSHFKKIKIIASSSSIKDKNIFLEGINVLNRIGFVPEENNILNRNWNDFAGDDQSRFKELQDSAEYPITIFAKGGWGSARLLHNELTKNNGYIIGFSDATSILWAKLNSGEKGCIHGPMLMNLPSEPSWSINRLKSLLLHKKVEDLKGRTLFKGKAHGKLIVGNLTVATHLIGTRFFPSTKEAILILEDINEPSYKIDRMLTQWKLAGAFNKLAGIGFGNFSFTDETNEDQRIKIEEVLIEKSKELGIPAIADLPVGHKPGNASLPLGSIAEINGYKGTLKIKTLI
tara:strand:- start:3646 stop:4515 length:870 start_codon:yes stop_codon:yes gene_type:complete